MAESRSAFSVEAHAANLNHDGFTIIEGFLDQATLAEVRAGLKPHLGTHRGRNAFEGFTTERVYTLVGRGAVFERLAANERLLSLIGRFLQPNFLLSAAQAICIHPGEAQQALHHDDSFYRVPRPRAALSITIIAAIDDFTPDNGGTMICPGSQNLGDGIDRTQLQSKCAAMPAGSCLILLGTLLHGGGANRSNAPRLAITYQYCEGWLRQQENFFLAIPKDIAKNMSPRLRELIGYSIWPPFMGMLTAYHPDRVFDDNFVVPVASEPRS